MLKRYKRILYILGVIIFFNFCHLTVMAQLNADPKKTVNVDVCKESAMPLNLFNLLGIQISASNGYWMDQGGKTVTNIFIPSSFNLGKYEYTYTITTQNYCQAGFGDKFLVAINLKVCNPLPPIQSYYYFCQNDFTEKYSEVLIEPKTMETLFFKASTDPAVLNYDWTGCTVKVYDNETTTTETDKDWFVNAVNNGYSANDGLIAKYIEITTPDHGTQPRQKITVQLYNEPSYYSLEILNPKAEWSVDDIVQFKTLPDNMAWYYYYLNNRLLDKVENSNLFNTPAVSFTGTVNDVMKVQMLEKIIMSLPKSKDGTCSWDFSESVLINVAFPNVFTPDGDGINDVFLGGDKFKSREFHLEIINRYGNRLYSGDEGWDGTYKGSPVPSGTYFYVVNIKMQDGTTRTVKGAVTLIRKER